MQPILFMLCFMHLFIQETVWQKGRRGELYLDLEKFDGKSFFCYYNVCDFFWIPFSSICCRVSGFQMNIITGSQNGKILNHRIKIAIVAGRKPTKIPQWSE